MLPAATEHPLAAKRSNLHMVYITNFKCGPDSYIKHFAREAAGAPLLVLQFDGHGNDAGYMTRCEAYLDGKPLAGKRSNLHMVYITNFKCGPDSYIKHFAREAAGAPLLVLQFDEIGIASGRERG